LSLLEDRRRKLTTDDYQRIRFSYYYEDCSIRELANEFGVSTKYIKKKLGRGVDVTGNQMADISVSHEDCSGCGRFFSSSGLQEHFFTWTSGGLHALTCNSVMPGRMI